MLARRGLGLLSIGLFCTLLAVGLLAADKENAPSGRESFMKSFRDGNFKVAYDGLRKLALDPKDDPERVSTDLTTAVQCLQNLGRQDEADAFREGVITAHSGNWKLLQAAALSYNNSEHYGFLVAGSFHRGHHRGGGKFVGSAKRDRARALQLMQQAMPLANKSATKLEAADFYKQFADLVLQGGGTYEPWRLQYLTDLTKLPDYDVNENPWRGRFGRGFGGSNGRGAPVDEQGKPVYHRVPKSYEAATSDGERWRWMLTQVVELAPNRASEVDLVLANFFRSQFGVQSMAYLGFGSGGGEQKTGTFALHTLKDDETIAALATGVSRFTLPDEFNWIKIFERITKRGKSDAGATARDALAGEFADRRQYVKAADAWKTAIAEYGPGNHSHRQNALDQIVKNWGRFEPGITQPAGGKTVVDYRFRNGSKVSLEAHAIKVDKLLADVRAYFAADPATVDWQQQNIQDIGHRLVELNQTKYLGDKVATWAEALKPRDGHVDERVTIKVPITNPGAYFVTAKMEDGNISRIVVWVADTVIVKKQLSGKVLYYVADAVNGQPVAKADIDLFGWRMLFVQNGKWKTEHTSASKTTDADGQLIVGEGDQPTGYNWLVTARKAKDGHGGNDRLAYLGFTNVWYGATHDPAYNATRVFVMTDRPVYRPENAVEFKAWVRHAKYDQADTSDFAKQSFPVVIHNPKGDKVFEKSFTTDEFAGLNGEWKLPKDATLGVYQVTVGNLGGGSFRVEEYKKPEYEVTVEAPKEPVRLGEKVEATIQAKYYFGAPVTRAKVKYKVMRSEQSNSWYPAARWDWFYGTGYWWFASDYVWYPGWAEWGCKRPFHPWWGHMPNNPPEVVLENEVEIGPDGIVKVTIDTTAAKELHPDQDHSFAITAEVVDESRRTIVGNGNVLVSRKPFSVFAWLDHGYYRSGETVKASFRALTLDRKPVEGKGELTLNAITYKDGKPTETAVQTWNLDTDAQGEARQQLKAAKPGQYRLSYKVTDAKKHTIEGGYVFTVRGEGFDGGDFRFNDIEIITDKREYQAGDKAKVLLNTNRTDAAVLLFLRPTNGVYLAPKLVRIKGKSTVEEIDVTQKDMPNFFVEAVTVHGGGVHSEVRELVVPPEKRIVNVDVLPNQKEYKPGEKATVKLRLTDLEGKPFTGSTVMTVYDRSVDYIAGGSNVPEIREFFWKWRRSHYPGGETSLSHALHNLVKSGEVSMGDLGIFGASVVDEMHYKGALMPVSRVAPMAPMAPGFGGGFGGRNGAALADGAAMEMDQFASGKADFGGEKLAERKDADKAGAAPPAPGAPDVEPTVRKNFADTAFWKASVTADKNGEAEITFPMPEQLTGWKVKVWALGHGTKVGEGETEITTKKNLLVRLQSPRFFTQKDEVVLSANVHNYLKGEKSVKVTLEVEGGTLAIQGDALQVVKIPANGEHRVDWRVKVTNEGQAVVRMKAVSDEESDAMQMTFPCHVHGMLKTESFSGVVRAEEDSGKLTFKVPAERRIPETVLEIRYSPTLAAAMVDALPYLVDYPYGCTEQTLNRFLPTVITHRTLQRMKLDLKDIEKKRTNLNAAELGDAGERAKGWKRYPRNPVFDEAEVKSMSLSGVRALLNMQCSDGGWGWFSGYGEHSWPHTTATVVHGLALARTNDIPVEAAVIQRGTAWLKNYQDEQIRMLNNAPQKIHPWKDHADDVDALVYKVLVWDGNTSDVTMRDFLYRDRLGLSAYGKALFGLALYQEKEAKKLAMVIENIDQFLVEDRENQTSYLKLPAGNAWWMWYGNEIEADATYLKLLSLTAPKAPKTAGLVKYLLNNRKHSTYWNSTRDTALCIEAMADYLQASGEDKPDMTVEVWLDGKKQKEVKIDSTNLFSFDNALVLTGDKVTNGKHEVEIRKKGTGPVYFNAYLTNFTLEDFITRAGLEVKVNRTYYRLTKLDEKIKVPGSRGQASDQRIEKFARTELKSGEKLKSGDLVEVELVIESKNDYEYLMFEDLRAAGFEPMAVRSGYNGNEMGAYMEVRDDRACFFVRTLARGKHSLSYRMRAEIPGTFSALPTKAEAMYAPELKGNSDEIKLSITD
jgi:alpha-2-macroglobulin